jgi:hypothetical protein
LSLNGNEKEVGTNISNSCNYSSKS